MNGIFFAWENVTGGGCWSALGLSPGFEEPESHGGPKYWQLIALADNVRIDEID